MLNTPRALWRDTNTCQIKLNNLRTGIIWLVCLVSDPCSLNIFVLHNCDAMSIDSELICVVNVDDLADQPDAKLHHDVSQLKPKDYHDYFFSNSHAALPVKAGSQNRWEIKTNCKLCISAHATSRKEVKGIDSYSNFKTHVL